MAEDVAGVQAEVSNIAVSDALDKCEQIKLLHYQLMTIYVYAIDTVRSRDQLPKGSEPPVRRRRSQSMESAAGRPEAQPGEVSPKRPPRRRPRFLRHGVITRALAESHIKGQLRKLRIAYAQLEQCVFETDSTASFRTWLRDCQDSLARFSATLSFTNFARKIAVALWPLVVTLAAVGAVWNFIFRMFAREKSTPGTLAELGIIALITTVYLITGLSIAATRKRSFFLAPISLFPAKVYGNRAQAALNVTADNVYQAEDNLFAAINVPKRSEFPLDMCLFAAAFCEWATLEAIVGFTNVQSVGGRIFFAAATVMFAIAAAGSLVAGFKRKIK